MRYTDKGLELRYLSIPRFSKSIRPSSRGRGAYSAYMRLTNSGARSKLSLSTDYGQASRPVQIRGVPETVSRTSISGGWPTRQAGASHAPPPVGFPDLETRVHGFALKREDTEDALVDPAKRLLPNEPLQGFDAESKFTQRQ